MKRTICLMLGLCLTGFIFAEEEASDDARSAEALEILNKADQKIKSIHAVRYTVSSTATGSALRFISPAEGDAVMIGWAESLRMPEKFWVHLKTSNPESEEETELTSGGNGDTFFIVDHGTKKAYEDMDPAVMGSAGGTLQNFGMREFVHNAPFEDELSAEKIEMLGTETVGGEECFKIHITYSEGRGESTWYFSKEDYLPRQRVRHFDIPNIGEGSLSVTIANLEIDPQIDADMFKLTLPDGYEQIDDFAP